MAESIVDCFEIIEIDKNQQHAALLFPGLRKLRGKMLKQRAAIRQTRKLVGIRMHLQRDVSRPKLLYQRLFLNVMGDEVGKQIHHLLTLNVIGLSCPAGGAQRAE